MHKLKFREKFHKEAIHAIAEAKNELRPFLERLDFTRISKHNCGYLKYAQDPVKYFIDGELIRYLYTVNFIYSSFPKKIKILDIGFFIPVIPIALSKLGFSVTAIEKLSYYDGALDEIIQFTMERYGIQVLDLDLFDDKLPKLEYQFDIILLLAILEHLNGTPKYLLEKIQRLVKPEGCLIVEVPNVASLNKRLVMLIKGKSPYPLFEDYYHSEYPFSGHSREYTVGDLKYALEQSGFDITKLKVFHHSALMPQSFKGKILRILELVGPPSWKPNIWVMAKPKISFPKMGGGLIL